jgi:hypothetical protein
LCSSVGKPVHLLLSICDVQGENASCSHGVCPALDRKKNMYYAGRREHAHFTTIDVYISHNGSKYPTILYKSRATWNWQTKTKKDQNHSCLEVQMYNSAQRSSNSCKARCAWPSCRTKAGTQRGGGANDVMIFKIIRRHHYFLVVFRCRG